jgi:aspartate kinase
LSNEHEAGDSTEFGKGLQKLMIVMKFGGTSVEDARAIRQLVKIVHGRHQERPVIVSSAMAGVTDTLLDAALSAKAGDAEKTQTILHYIRSRHIETARELLCDSRQMETGIAGLLIELRSLLETVSELRDLTPRLKDGIAAFGERLSTPLVAAALQEAGMNAVLVDSRNCILTDDQFTCASPLTVETGRHLRATLIPMLLAKHVPVLAGFVGSTVHGETTTLGRGGSDFTAAIVGAALDAKCVEIWTDVDGICTTDPRLYPRARHIESISFEEASELARRGAKVLHPSTLIPAMEKNIPVYVLNSRNPRHPGTCVRARSSGIEGVRAIAVKRGITLVTASAPRTFRPSGLIWKLLSSLEANGCVPDIASMSDTSVTMAIEGKKKELVTLLRNQYGESISIHAENSKAIVSIVAEDVHEILGGTARMFLALEGIDVWLASPGASRRSVSFVVAERDVLEAVSRLHKALIEDSVQVNQGLPVTAELAEHI